MHARTAVVGAALGVLLLSSPAPAQDAPAAAPESAQDLSGSYAVKGQDPQGSVRYEGKVAVVKLGSTYRVAWALEDHRAVGTGILTAKTFAVTFVSEGLPMPGLALFELAPNGQLTGRFTLLGAQDVGLETWTPQTH